MYISFAESCAKGFKKWSASHRPAGNDNNGDVPNEAAVTVALSGASRGTDQLGNSQVD